MSIIDVSSMEIGALNSHMNGKKHKKAMESEQSVLLLGQLFNQILVKLIVIKPEGNYFLNLIDMYTKKIY